MRYKKMTVWSGGSERARTAKIQFIGYSVSFVLLCVLHIMFFVCDFHDDKSVPMTLGEHIFCGLTLSMFTGLLTVLSLFSAKKEFVNIKKNKLITLELYELEEYAKIGEIPKEKFILFSDGGIVLAYKEDEEESRSFAFGTKYFNEFVNYYNKHAVEKIEIDK